MKKRDGPLWALVAILIVIAVSFGAQALSISQKGKGVGDKVMISGNLSQNILQIISGNRTYSYAGLGTSSFSFTPTESGTHTVKLITPSGEFLNEANFSVNPKKGTTISTDKGKYYLGESATITVSPSGNQTINIVSPFGIYRFIGPYEGQLIFSPSSAGNYEIQSFNGADIEASATFQVVKKPLSDIVSVALEKTEYNLGESVPIRLIEKSKENLIYTITVRFDGGSYQYIGVDARSNLQFTPRRLGTYYVKIEQAGDFIDSATFNVSQKQLLNPTTPTAHFFNIGTNITFKLDFSDSVREKRTFIHDFFGLTPISKISAYMKDHEQEFNPQTSYQGSDIFNIKVPTSESTIPGEYTLIVEAYAENEIINSSIPIILGAYVEQGQLNKSAELATYSPFVNDSFLLSELPAIQLSFYVQTQRSLIDAALKRTQFNQVTALVEGFENSPNVTISLKHNGFDNFTATVTPKGIVSEDLYKLVMIGRKGDDTFRVEKFFNWGITNSSILAEKINQKFTSEKPAQGFKFDIKDNKGRERSGNIKIYSRQLKEKLKEFKSEKQELIEEGIYDVDIDFPDQAVSKIAMKGVNIKQRMAMGIDDLDPSSRSDAPQKNLKWKKVYAIDPSSINFTSATITVPKATGNTLYKCIEWNFSTNTCYGEWKKFMDLTLGEPYTFEMNSTDPGFGESVPVPRLWWNASIGGVQETIQFCKDINCDNTSTNFQAGEIIYVWVNTTPENLNMGGTNRLRLFPGGSQSAVSIKAFNCTDSGTLRAACYGNFTVDASWSGWYVIEYLLDQGANEHSFEHTITIGTEPVSGNHLKFFRDAGYTIEADSFFSGEQVYFEYSTGSASVADVTDSAPEISDLNDARTAITESFSSTTDPFRLNFSMPSTLTAGNWYWFEPQLADGAGNRIPSGGGFVHGRAIKYEANNPVNVTNVSTNSPPTNQKLLGQNVTWWANFTDADELDRHKMLVCQNHTVHQGNSTCNSTTHCETSFKLWANFNCSKTLTLADPANQTAYVFICDARGNCSNASISWGVLRDVVSPTVKLNQPLNSSVSSSSTVQFEYAPADNGNFSNCSLWTNESGGFSIASTSTSIDNDTNNFFAKSFTANGYYLWNVECIDTWNNKAVNLTNFTLVINAPPIVQMMGPLNNTFVSATNISQSFNVSAAAAISNCTLYISEVENISNLSISLNTRINFSTQSFKDGPYNWSVNCTTIYNDTGESFRFAFTVDTILPNISIETPTPPHDNYHNTSVLIINISHNETNPAMIVLNFSGTIYKRSYSGEFTNFTLTEIDDGNYNYTITLNDSAANFIATSTMHVHVDRSTVKTYNDTYYLVPLRRFPSGTTVYSRLRNGTNLTNYTVEYFEPGASKYTYRGSPIISTSEGNATHNYTFSTQDVLGNWTVAYYMNPWFSKYKKLLHNKPRYGNQTGAAFDMGFYTINRESQNITTDESFAINATLHTVHGQSPTLIFTEKPSTANGWTQATGSYTRNYNPAAAVILRLTVTANNNTNRETGDQYNVTLENIKMMTTTTQGTSNINEPSIIEITNISYSQPKRQIRLQLDIYKLDYEEKITSFSSSPVWIINATEAADFNNDNSQTSYQGTVPEYNSSTGYWESLINLSYTGKYFIQSQLISATNARFKPKDSIMINRVGAATFDIIVGTTSVTLNYPTNDYASTNRSVSFNYTAADTYNFKNCSLYTNGTGVWRTNTSNKTAVLNGGAEYLNYTFTADGHFVWNVQCRTVSDLNISDPTNRTVYADTTRPVIYLFGPVNNTKWTNSSIVDFEYNVSDLTPIVNCSLILGGTITQTEEGPITKGQNVIMSANLENGLYNWSINCTDTAGYTNASKFRNLSVSVVAVAYNATWFETSTASCASSTCNINLANARDTTGNKNIFSISTQQAKTMAIAKSPYMGAQALIPSGTAINLSGEFQSSSANSYGVSYATYQFYVVNTSGKFLITQYGNNGTDGIKLGTVGDSANTIYVLSGVNNTEKEWLISETDRLELDVTMFNQYSGSQSYQHSWDGLNRSMVNISEFHYLGSLIVNMTNTTGANLSLNQSAAFNISCNVSCSFGECLNTTAYVQRNESGAWINVDASSGNIRLNGTETNAHYIGNISNYQSGYNKTSFILRTMNPGSDLIRCASVSLYSTENGTNITRVNTIDIFNPKVSLHTPSNNTLSSTKSVLFNFTPTDNGQILNCSSWANETAAFQPTDYNSSITNNTYNVVVGRFKRNGAYKWNIECIDTYGNRASNHTNFTVIVNATVNVTLISPFNNTMSTSKNITFNFTVSTTFPNVSNCTLTLNRLPNITNTTIATDVTSNFSTLRLEEGRYNWSVNCTTIYNETGESRTFFFGVDLTPPTLNFSSPTPTHDSVVNNSVLTINISHREINPDRLLLNFSGEWNGLYYYSGNFTNLTINVDDGQYNLSVLINDSAGRENVTEIRTFLVDASLLKTYNDSNFTQRKRIFARTETVFTLLKNGSNSSNYTIEYTKPSASLFIYRDQANSTPDGNATGNRTFGSTESLGNWLIRFYHNPQFFKWKTIFRHDPSTGSQSGAFDQTFYLYSRNESNITLNNSQALHVLLARVDQSPIAVIWDQEPSGENGWSFNTSNGKYSKSYSPAANRVFMFTAWADNATNPEAEDGYLSAVELTDFQATGTQATSNADEPSKLIIKNMTYPQDKRRVKVEFDIYKLDYLTKITSLASNVSWMLNATESNDYNNDGTRTTYLGTRPEYNSSTGAWDAYFNLSIPGKYFISVQLTSANNTIFSPKHGIIINRAAMNKFNLIRGIAIVTLYAPATANISTNRTISFNYTASDIQQFKNCSLYSNGTGTWKSNVSNSSIVNPDEPNYLNYTFNTDGYFIWNVICRTYNEQNVTDSANRTTTVDTSKPVIVLLGPQNNTKWANSSVVDFDYVPYDLTQVQNCTLYLHNESQMSSSSITNGAVNRFSVSLNNGNYNWSVNCTDSTGLANSSLRRNITVEVTALPWNGTWFETYTSGCSESACDINLGMLRDATPNKATNTINASSGRVMASAFSPFMGGEVMVPTNVSINFSAVMSANDSAAYGAGNVSFWLFVANLSGEYLLAQFGDNTTGGIHFGTGTENANTSLVISALNYTAKQWILSETDKLKLNVVIYNTHANPHIYQHDWDSLNRSLVNISRFFYLGTLKANLTNPLQNKTVDEGQIINVSCNVSCVFGWCLNTTVYVQLNSSATEWTNIGSSGNIVLNGTETNAHLIGNISYFQPGNFTNFTLRAATTSSNLIRCVAISDFSAINGSNTTKVNIRDITPPTISLDHPPDNVFENFTVSFIFTPSDAATISECDLVLNGKFNRSLTSVTNGIPNTINSTANFTEGLHNWSINCTDSSGNVNLSINRTIIIDNGAPNITLRAPANKSFEISLGVTFNFTVRDNWAMNTSCDLMIDGRVNISDINVTNATNESYTINDFSAGNHTWNVSCADPAGNFNTSLRFFFTINDTPPVVRLNSPADKIWDNDGKINLTYNVTEDIGVENCSLYLNTILNQTNITIAVNTTNNFTLEDLPEIDFNWTVDCWDVGNKRSWASTNRSFYIDKTRPYINLTTPANDTVITSSSLDLKFIPYDNRNTSMTCNISLDGNTSTLFSASNATETTRSYSGLKDGFHFWNATCWDSVPNRNNSERRVFNVSVLPTITLGSPSSGTHTGNNVTFFYTPADNEGFTNCSLIIDGTINQTATTLSIRNNAENNFTAFNISQEYHTWNISCYDNGTYRHSASATKKNFSVDITPPNITLNLPTDNFKAEVSNVTFNWTASDNNATSLKCNLTFNGAVNRSDVNATAGVIANATINNLKNGDYQWNVTCWDGVNNSNFTSTRILQVRIGPSVILSSPSNNAWDVDGNITFSYVPSSNFGTGEENCSLYINDVYNKTNQSLVIDDGTNIFNLNATPEGNYTWKVQCYDRFNATTISDTRAFKVDKTPPYIALVEPVNYFNSTFEYLPLNFSVTDNLATTLNCNITVNGTIINQTTATNGTNTSIINIFTDGMHIWNVSCSDETLSSNTSISRIFTMNRSPELSILTPQNGTWYGQNNFTIATSPYDNDNLTNCSIIIDGTINSTNFTIKNNQINNITSFNVTEGIHNINASCTDNGTYKRVNTSAGTTIIVDITAPNTTLNFPERGYWNNLTSISFDYTTSDNLASTMYCNFSINSHSLRSNLQTPNATGSSFTISNLSDNSYSWNITCADKAGKANASETRILNHSITPTITITSPANNSWINTQNATFTYTISDNDNISNCTLGIDSLINQSNVSVNAAGSNSFVTASIEEGTHNWSISCIDNGTYHLYNTTYQRILSVDQNRPNITLHGPAHNILNPSANVDFNFTAFDNLLNNMTCNITINSIVNLSVNATNGTSVNRTVLNFQNGVYTWNVTCIDLAGNLNISETRNFTIRRSDLQIYFPHFYFNNTLIEKNSILLTANISNTGSVPAINFIVAFFNGSSQIGSNQTFNLSAGQNLSTNVTWNPPLGFQEVLVALDPKELILEESEANNNLTINVSVPLWNIVFGNLSGTYLISLNGSAIYKWNATTFSRGYVFVTDSDSIISWVNITPLGINLTGHNVSSDFEEADSYIGAAGLNDSINMTFTFGGLPIYKDTLYAFGKTIYNVSMVNTTNSTLFRTGILWDASDTINESYNGTQDLIIVANANQSLNGRYGVYDYEIRIPSKIRNVKGPDYSQVTFYVELK